MIALKRPYEPARGDDGQRFFVQRLWPRGVKKAALRISGWLKDVAPSTELRKWFSHDPAKWDEFRRRYFAELDAHRDALQPLLDAAREGKHARLQFARPGAQQRGCAEGIFESELSLAHVHRTRAA
jgi:uncharacterized protein YeaO (DUF488 family)